MKADVRRSTLNPLGWSAVRLSSGLIAFVPYICSSNWSNVNSQMNHNNSIKFWSDKSYQSQTQSIFQYF